MTSASTITPSSTPADARPSSTGGGADGPQVRLEMKPEGKTTGHVDGGWWPRSRSLEDELPGLVEALTPRLGPVERVSYHLGEWESPPSAVNVDGVSVRLGGYRLQGAASLDVIARDRRVTVLVVDPEQTEQLAGAALKASGAAGNTDDVATLLAQAKG
jgi:hypothetical protein